MGNNKNKTPYLHYIFRTPPTGLRCSIDQTNLQTEYLELSIGNTRGSTVEVKSITLSFPLGADQANTLTGGSFMTFNYSPSAGFLVNQTSPGVFRITAPDGKSTINWLNQGLYIRFSGIVMNTTLGVAKIKIEENSANNNNGYQTRIGWWWMGKYPYAFFMRDLTADKAMINANEKVTLTWVGAENAQYTMKWTDASGPQSRDVTNVRSWVSPPLLQNTVFQLVGRTVSGPAETITLEATILVENAVSTSNGLIVNGGEVKLNCNDQDVAVFSNKIGTVTSFAPSGGAIYQYFQVTGAGTLAWVDVYFTSISNSGCVKVNFAKGDPGGSMTVLADAHSKPIANQWTRVVFDKTVTLSKGVGYLLQFVKENNSTYTLGASQNPIPGAVLNGASAGVNLWMEVNIQSVGMTVTTDGNVGIGNAQPTYPLDVVGTARATHFLESSDISLKQNIATLPDALAQLLQLRGVSYERRDGGQQEIGLISQEVAEVIPALVQEDAQGLGAVAYTRLTAVLVEALKALHGEVEALRAEVRALRGE